MYNDNSCFINLVTKASIYVHRETNSLVKKLCRLSPRYSRPILNYLLGDQITA